MTFRWTISGLKMIQGDGTTTLLSYGEITVYAIIIGICIGLIIGLIVSYISKKRNAGIIRILIALKADSEESALTVGELEENGTRIAQRFLKTASPLRKYVMCSNSSTAEKEVSSGFVRALCRIFSREEPKRTDFKEAKFFLPDSKRVPAEVRFDEGKMTAATVIISILLIIGLGIGAMYLVPKLIDMAQSVFGAK